VFQSTRPRGARPFSPGVDSAIPTFQSTRPRGARPASGYNVVVLVPFQSTRPRGARLYRPFRKRTGAVVSIHAPARGATLPVAHIKPMLVVSIHAPARGATATTTGRPSAMKRFNPRARAGRDGNGAVRSAGL